MLRCRASATLAYQALVTYLLAQGAQLASSVQDVVAKRHGDVAVSLAREQALAGTGLGLLLKQGFAPSAVLDVGANVGNWTRQHRAIFPEAQFLMVDGTDHSEKWADLLGSGHVEAEVAVLDSEPHEVEWFEHKMAHMGNGIRKEQTRIFRDVQGRHRVAETLDALLERTGRRDQRFSFLKLDVQGSELDVLRGAQRTLAGAEVVRLEVPVAGSWNKGAPSFAEYISFMDGAGFAPFDVPELHRVDCVSVVHGCLKGAGGEGYLVQMDIVFARKGSRFQTAAQGVLPFQTAFHPSDNQTSRPFLYHNSNSSHYK